MKMVNGTMVLTVMLIVLSVGVIASRQRTTEQLRFVCPENYECHADGYTITMVGPLTPVVP